MLLQALACPLCARAAAVFGIFGRQDSACRWWRSCCVWTAASHSLDCVVYCAALADPALLILGWVLAGHAGIDTAAATVEQHATYFTYAVQHCSTRYGAIAFCGWLLWRRKSCREVRLACGGPVAYGGSVVRREVVWPAASDTAPFTGISALSKLAGTHLTVRWMNLVQHYDSVWLCF